MIMSSTPTISDLPPPPEAQCEGEMAERIRILDWSRTPLGPAESWSPALRMMVPFMLANRFPLLLWWGPEFVSIYNDAYRPILGIKHPSGLGQPVSECWQEIWHILRPLIETPFRGGPATWMEDILLEIRRHGYPEETHFTIAYSPVPDDTVPGGIGGVLATVHEITDKVVSERRVIALRDLSFQSCEIKSAGDACAAAALALRPHAKDVPFALLYLLDADGKQARLAAAAGTETDAAFSPAVVDLAARAEAWPFSAVLASEKMQLVEPLGERFAAVPPGPWSDPPRCAAVVPIKSNLAHQLAGFLIVGISSRLRFDERYASFVELMAAQIATAVANARAYDEERQRAAKLAELDRAKTMFFSNVSHEFRTPLTLMLAPLEDLLHPGAAPSAEQVRGLAEVAHRNGLRLLRLVNTLLDFSRIEAGRARAEFEKTDLAALTAELAAAFRATIERTKLEYRVTCAPAAEPAYVDREMWEKIVFNLLSNAFKYTLAGSIELSFTGTAAAFVLTVRDTGTGIPKEAKAHLFERFYRVKGAQGRTHEGTGIGLALVSELVAQHGGTVSCASEVGCGSAFTVMIPRGSAHLPAAQVRPGPPRAISVSGNLPAVEEAADWLTPAPAALAPENLPSPPLPSGAKPPRRSVVLLADDNADMRAYLQRLLSDRFDVIAVGNGREALDAMARVKPDLVLSDVMMPHVDGFELLRHIRRSAEFAATPVLLLSARAGEEARIDGVESGADDYLVKPFNSRELVARMQTQLTMAAARKDHENALRTARDELARHAAALERVVEERTRRLSETVAELETFSYSIAHDMRAPLRSMRGFSRILLEEHAAGLDEEARGFLRRIGSSAERMDQLIQDVLTFSRISSSEMALTSVDTDQLVRALIDTYPNLQTGQASLLIAGTLPVVLGNEAALTQTFSNLLDNAVKFRRPNASAVVEISAQVRDGRARISIRDHGIGIAPDHHDKIFQIFQQLSREYEGTGIGLAIVKKSVERMGGAVGLDSAAGAGATFWVEFPVPTDAAAATVP